MTAVEHEPGHFENPLPTRDHPCPECGSGLVVEPAPLAEELLVATMAPHLYGRYMTRVMVACRPCGWAGSALRRPA